MKDVDVKGVAGSKVGLTRLGGILLTLALLSGCGGKGEFSPEAPKNPGTAVELAGTAWTDPESNTTYMFADKGNLDVIKPDLPDPVLGFFAVNDGIVDLTVGLTTLSGTWDGRELVVEGVSLTQE